MRAPSRRALFAAGLLSGLAACAEAPPERPALSVGLQSAAGAPAAIEVWARDAFPLVAAELMVPEGRRIAATILESTLPGARRGSFGRSEIGIGAAGGSSGNVGAGIAIGIPLFLGGGSAPSLILSRAVIPLADPADFRARWTAYRVRLAFGTRGGDGREVMMPAPDPSTR